MNATQTKSVNSIAKIVGVDKLDETLSTIVKSKIESDVVCGYDADTIIDAINKMPKMVAIRETYLAETIGNITEMVNALPLGSINHGDALHLAMLSRIKSVDVKQNVVVLGDNEHTFDNAKSMMRNLMFNDEPLWKLAFDDVDAFETNSFSAPRKLGVINQRHTLFTACYGTNSGEWIDGNGVLHKNWNGPIRLVAVNDETGKSIVSHK